MLTLGELGLALINNSKPTYDIDIVPAVRQVTTHYEIGAGDNALVAFVVGHLNGLDKSRSAELAGLASGTLVGRRRGALPCLGPKEYRTMLEFFFSGVDRGEYPPPPWF